MKMCCTERDMANSIPSSRCNSWKFAMTHFRWGLEPQLFSLAKVSNPASLDKILL